MTRLNAFGIHLGISLLIFVALAYLVLFVWYPDLFFSTDGGWQGMRLIIAVDLVLGPLLTLIVFKARKPGLKFDLTCIGLFQAVCLTAGTFIVFSERPLAVVYADGQFSSMSAGSYRDAGLEVPDLSHIPGSTPKWVMIDFPEDLNEHADFRRDMLQQGRRLELAVDRYVPFDPTAEAVVAEPYDVETLLARDSDTQQVPLWLAEHGGGVDDYRFYPLGTRYDYVFLGFSKDAELLGVLNTKAPI